MKIYFLNGNTQEIENHYFEKEYRNDIIIEIDNEFYEVHFFTKEALEYEMTKDGFFSLVGIIILEEILTNIIIESVRQLHKKGFFYRFKGEKNLNPDERFMNNWYINTIESNYDNLCIMEITPI